MLWYHLRDMYLVGEQRGFAQSAPIVLNRGRACGIGPGAEPSKRRAIAGLHTLANALHDDAAGTGAQQLASLCWILLCLWRSLV